MEANLIVVGGPISVGKSTLVSSLPFPQVPELDASDKIQTLLLEHTYQKGRVAPEVIEHYFAALRKARYKEYAQTLQTHVLDRSIFESLWFARENMGERSFVHFKRMWKDEIKELLKEVGKPKLYVLLTFSWETFQDRLFSRGREVEVKNFSSNIDFFKRHVADYEKHMIEVFDMFGLNYFVLNTDNMSMDDVFGVVTKKLKEVL